MICDATAELEEHVNDLDRRVKLLAANNDNTPAEDDMELQALLEEKESTQQGLNMCAQLSAQIGKLEQGSKEHPKFSQRPSSHKHIKTDLPGAKGSIQSLSLKLQAHLEAIVTQVEAMKSANTLSEDGATQLATMEEIRDSVEQCMKVVAEGADTLAYERYNVFEDITIAKESYGITAASLKDLVLARRLNVTDRSRYIGGQFSEEGYQMTIERLVDLDTNIHTPKHDGNKPSYDPGNEIEGKTNFNGRYGQGRTMSSSNMSRDVA
jgi:hypothetical protein